jgi:ferric-dicitrate binding protein FerR (iron transport regulator)
MKSAAIMALLVGVGFIFKSAVVDSDAAPIIPEDAIILQLENGKIEVLSEGGTATVVDAQGNVLGSQQGSQIVYKNNGASKVELIYNTLTVPYGKRFDLLLSDGTQVTLNSGTSLKYPVQFLKAGSRQVFLDGEAFFSVAKDSVNPFIVNTNELNVRVLGTKFNLSSYPEDQFVNTTLLEGSVAVYNSQDTFDSSKASLLEPGYRAEWNKHDKKILVEEADIAMHTDWLNGKIILRHLPFKNIVKKLERHYNVEIINNNQGLAEELFTASFDVETVDQVFKTFNSTYKMDYKINDRQIIIN